MVLEFGVGVCCGGGGGGEGGIRTEDEEMNKIKKNKEYNL